MKKKILVKQDDYLLLTNFIESNRNSLSNYTYNKLSKELKDAEIISESKLPDNVIGVNSEIEVEESGSNKKMKIKLVLPKNSNPKIFHISIFAPIGTALIGYRTGDSVEWEVGGKLRTFRILNVKN